MCFQKKVILIKKRQMSNPLLFLFPIVSSAIEKLPKVCYFSRHLHFMCSSLTGELLLTPHLQLH